MTPYSFWALHATNSENVQVKDFTYFGTQLQVTIFVTPVELWAFWLGKDVVTMAIPEALLLFAVVEDDDVTPPPPPRIRDVTV